MNALRVADPFTSFRIRVALVEDDPAMRGRLAMAITASAGLSLLYCAETATEMLSWLVHNQPDVLLVDLGLPDRSGLDVISGCRRLAPQAEVMVITLFGDEQNMIRAFEAGAKGYLLKDGTEADLAQHVMSLHAGGSPMSPIIARQLLTRMTQPAAPVVAPVATARLAGAMSGRGSEALTPRELEILTLLARGYTYPELSKLLAIALSTIQTHVKNIYGKLAVHNKVEAVYEARQLGLLDS
jgi:DNA-binding NarL/FixJ family response regulator